MDKQKAKKIINSKLVTWYDAVKHDIDSLIIGEADDNSLKNKLALSRCATALSDDAKCDITKKWDVLFVLLRASESQDVDLDQDKFWRPTIEEYLTAVEKRDRLLSNSTRFPWPDCKLLYHQQMTTALRASGNVQGCGPHLDQEVRENALGEAAAAGVKYLLAACHEFCQAEGDGQSDEKDATPEGRLRFIGSIIKDFLKLVT